MFSILIALGILMLINICLLMLSYKQDPSEMENDPNREETSERITYLKDYEPYWEKEIEF